MNFNLIIHKPQSVMCLCEVAVTYAAPWHAEGRDRITTTIFRLSIHPLFTHVSHDKTLRFTFFILVIFLSITWWYLLGI